MSGCGAERCVTAKAISIITAIRMIIIVITTFIIIMDGMRHPVDWVSVLHYRPELPNGKAKGKTNSSNTVKLCLFR